MAFFDLRLPLGWLFIIVGVLLLAAGFNGSPVSSDGHSLDVNINLIWAVVLLIFGAGCLVLAWNYARKRNRQKSSED